MTPAGWAAVWSAVAATFAAFAALMSMLIHRRNLLESVRPDLVVSEWARKRTGALDTVEWKAIRNVGRGAASRVVSGASEGRRSAPPPFFIGNVIQLLAPNDSVQTSFNFLVDWKKVPESTKPRIIPVTVWIFYSDSRAIRHETRYSLLVLEDLNAMVLDSVAPGVMLADRRTTSLPMWRRRLGGRVSKATRRLPRPWPR
jgi:heme exporter protein D